MDFEDDEPEQQPTTVIFCRHGETDWNLLKKFQGHRDIPLNSAGITQAEQLAKALQGHDLAAVVVSPLKRARQTGQAIANLARVQVNVDERLRERELGIMQGLTAEEVRAAHPDVWNAWKTQQAFPAAAEVEPGEYVVERVESVLFDLARQYPGRRVAVVGHGAALRCVLCRAVGTASITEFIVGPGRSWRLNLSDYSKHLGGLRGRGMFRDADTSDWGEDQSVTTVMLCRHGETDWNLARKFQGMMDIPLNMTGRKQAGYIATALARLGPQSIWCSPLRRARTTGNTVAKACGVKLKVDRRLRERHLGIMQGLNPTDLEREYPNVLEAWKAQVPLPEEAQAEPEHEVIERVEAVLYDLAAAHPGKSAAVILHGASIRCFLKRASGNSRITTPKNVSITTLLVGPGRRWRLVQSGDASHIPFNKCKEVAPGSEATPLAVQPTSSPAAAVSPIQPSIASAADSPATRSRL